MILLDQPLVFAQADACVKAGVKASEMDILQGTGLWEEKGWTSLLGWAVHLNVMLGSSNQIIRVSAHRIFTKLMVRVFSVELVKTAFGWMAVLG
jgi:hypothetical protein